MYPSSSVNVRCVGIQWGELIYPSTEIACKYTLLPVCPPSQQDIRMRVGFPLG